MEINKKYKLLYESLRAISKDVFNLLVLKGEAGMGKSYNIKKYIKDNNIKHEYFGSYSTPLEFYRLLYENRNKKLLIFDDLSSINNPTIIGLLKSACWSSLGEGRKVEYHSTSEVLEKLKLPKSFELKSNLIIINNSYSREFAPIISRSVFLDVSFTFEEKIAIFKDLQGTFILDKEIVEFVEENCSLSTKNLSVRSLVILSRLKNKQFDWKMFSKELLGIDSNKDLLEKILKRHDLVKDAMEEWCGQTGLKERSFYGRLKELKMGRNCSVSTELRKNGK